VTLASGKILILIPAFNEEKNIGGVIDEARKEISVLGFGCDILVVDDGSSDDTSGVAKERNCAVVRLPVNNGIGVAMQTGFKFALQNEYHALVRLDADGQHPASFIGGVLEPVLSGEADLCIGSRFLVKQGYQPSLMRRLGILWFSFLISLLFKKKITDPTSGFQAMNHRLIALYSREYASDYPEVEALVITLRAGYRVKEVPIMMKARQGGKSSIDWLRSVYYAIKVTTVTIISLMRKSEGE
jgi:hypothetical protein